MVSKKGLVACCRTVLSAVLVSQLSLGGLFVSPAQADTKKVHTETPIKHVIVLIGENRSFDHVFATYVPKKGETVKNLLSEGIVNADGAQ